MNNKHKENVIDLEYYRAKEGDRISKVFTGRDRGRYVREQSRLDEIEQQYDTISIVIPKNIYSINPSFLEELLVNVVTKLGKEKFFKKFNFSSEGDYSYEKPLYEAIDRILRNKTALE